MPAGNIPKMYYLPFCISKILYTVTRSPRNIEYQSQKRKAGGMRAHTACQVALRTLELYFPLLFSVGKYYYENTETEEVTSIS